MTNKRYEICVLQKFIEEINIRKYSRIKLTFEKSEDEQQDGFLVISSKKKFPLELVKATTEEYEKK